MRLCKAIDDLDEAMQEHFKVIDDLSALVNADAPVTPATPARLNPKLVPIAGHPDKLGKMISAVDRIIQDDLDAVYDAEAWRYLREAHGCPGGNGLNPTEQWDEATDELKADYRAYIAWSEGRS